MHERDVVGSSKIFDRKRLNLPTGDKRDGRDDVETGGQNTAERPDMIQAGPVTAIVDPISLRLESFMIETLKLVVHRNVAKNGHEKDRWQVHNRCEDQRN